MTTQEQNQQTIVEHIVNIDTTAEHISAINSVASIVVQMVAVAGMLPDIAATVAMRSTLLAVAKQLSVVQSVADAVPLLEAVRDMESEIRAAISCRVEISAVVAHLEAVRSLAGELDILILAPQHAAEAKLSAEAATEAASQIASQMDRAETARLGAELAEDHAKTSSETATIYSEKSAVSAAEAKQAAAAAAAVSGLPDASAASPGDPLIWDGISFAVGTLASTLAATENGLAVAETVLESITTAQATADALDAKVIAAHSAATEAKATAEGVDAKATQAASDAATAKSVAESAGANATTFEKRLATAENETFLLGQSQNTHSNSGDIHTTKSAIEAIASAAANTVKDGGDGSTLPEDRATLLALSSLIDEKDAVLNGFLNGAEPGERMAMLAELDRLASTLGGGLTRADVVNALDSDEQDAPLAAAQGSVIAGIINSLSLQVDAAGKPWVRVVSTVPATWPDSLQWDGLLLCYPMTDGAVSNPEWYVNNSGIPAQLVLDAMGIRLLDGTTVQTGVASSLTASVAAQTAAQTAQAAAEQAKTDAETAKTTAEGVDAKATAAQSTALEAHSEALSAKSDATDAKTTAEAIDAKATQAQSTATAAQTAATEAKATAEAVDSKATAAQATALEAKTTADGVDIKATQAQADATAALAKSPDLATQTVPGIVKGSSTVTVDATGALHVASSGSVGGGIFVGQWLFLRQTRLPVGYVELNGTLYTNASTKFPDLVPYLAENQDELTTETDWQARSAAASGTGGVPFYVHDAVANTLRMPDTRGDSPYHGTAGTWQGDAIRNITGDISSAGAGTLPVYYDTQATGALTIRLFANAPAGALSASQKWGSLGMDTSLSVPTDSTNHPRRIGLTFAVYAGTIGA